jgi:hypothetical protein
VWFVGIRCIKEGITSVARKGTKKPRKKRKPNTLDAISGTEALEVLRTLANRDKELSREIDAIARDLLGDVSLDEVANCVQAEFESLAVEDVWDQSGARRGGYVDPGEMACQMFASELEPFREDMRKYQQLSMFEQAEAVCLGILKGVYDFQWYSKTEFKNWAVDAPVESFWEYVGEWKTHFKQRSSPEKLQQFLTEHCPKWAERAMRTIRSRKKA